MAENLKPVGLPYGENKRALTQQRQAGLPTNVSATSQTPAAPPPVAPVRPSPLRPGPATDDPLMALNPTTPIAMAPTREQRFQQIAERSVNPMFKLIAARLAQP